MIGDCCKNQNLGYPDPPCYLTCLNCGAEDTGDSNREMEPNYRKVFLDAADRMYSDIYNGTTSIDTALLVLRGILEEKNLQGEKQGIKFEKK